jgi:hypothetical protein
MRACCCEHEGEGGARPTLRAQQLLYCNSSGERIVGHGLWPPRSPYLTATRFFLWEWTKEFIWTIHEPWRKRNNTKQAAANSDRETLRSVPRNTINALLFASEKMVVICRICKAVMLSYLYHMTTKNNSFVCLIPMPPKLTNTVVVRVALKIQHPVEWALPVPRFPDTTVQEIRCSHTSRHVVRHPLVLMHFKAWRTSSTHSPSILFNDTISISDQSRRSNEMIND